MPPPTTIRIALDWTPNTLHTGLYVAQQKGFYTQSNLSVQLLPPSPSYTTTPAKIVQNNQADLALCPSESCIAYAESRSSLQLQAIYTILQDDASAIASTTLSRPRELGEGRTYGSYNARYEDSVVKAMVAADGGDADGMRIQRQTGKLDLFCAMKEGKGEVDATWIFLPWEGVEAEMEGVELRTWRMEAFGVPYGYSPVIARNAVEMGLEEEALRRFVRETRRGYEYALQHVEEAVGILEGFCEPKRSMEFLRRSQGVVNGYYGGGEELGRMKEEKWEKWVGWLRAKALVKAEVDVESFFTNEFF